MNKRQATHLAKLYVKALANEMNDLLEDGGSTMSLHSEGFCPSEVEIYMEMHDLAHWTHDDTEGITNGEALKEINHGLAN
jgi:hypothetical protein